MIRERLAKSFSSVDGSFGFSKFQAAIALEMLAKCPDEMLKEMSGI